MALDRDVQRLVLRLLRTLDTPRGLTVALLIQYGEWDQLTRLRVDPLQYEPFFHRGVDLYRRDVQATEILRKYDDLDTSFDTAAVARASFLETERQCAETNLRLDRFLSHPVFETELESRASDLFDAARRWIRNTLGPLPQQLDGRFGPGATFESTQWAHRKMMVAYDKLRNKPTRAPALSSGLVDHLVWETVLSQAWSECCPNRLIPTVRGSRFATVPKDAAKDRGIAIEPGLNVWGQLAVGEAMRNRLKKRGLDLVKGQELHCRMAERASVDGLTATIDLSNASNTVSHSLVKLLLPAEWYDLLSELRCSFTRFPMPVVDKEGKPILNDDGTERLKARWVRLEMFSSMGNGYTFELETLLFAALAHACGGKVGHDTFVYGDDILIPTQLSADFIALLRYSGFTTNEKKTFTHGHFRESCGGDFMVGQDVRPIYITTSPEGPNAWITIANQLWSVASKWSFPELVAVRNMALDHVPTAVRACRGPSELGDLVIHDFQEHWNCRVRGSVRYFRVWRPVSERVYLRALKGSRVKLASPLRRGGFAYTFRETGVAFAAAVLGLPSDGLVPRKWGTDQDRVSGYRFGRVSFS